MDSSALPRSPIDRFWSAYLPGILEAVVGFALFDVTFYDARINVVHWVLLTGLYALTAPEISRQASISNIDPAGEF